MYYLAKIINDLNHKNFYARIYTIDNKYYENNLCNEYLKRGEEIDYDNTIVIYYENCTNTLNAKHNIRWIWQQNLYHIIDHNKNDMIYFWDNFEGSILASDSIALNTGASLNGRALAMTGAVTFDYNTIQIPEPGSTLLFGAGLVLLAMRRQRIHPRASLAFQL